MRSRLRRKRAAILEAVRIRGGLRGFLTAIDGRLDPDCPEPEELAFLPDRRNAERLASARRAHRARKARQVPERAPF